MLEWQQELLSTRLFWRSKWIILFLRKDIYLSKEHKTVWQASIIESDGSTPAKCGMKLAVTLNEEPFAIWVEGFRTHCYRDD